MIHDCFSHNILKKILRGHEILIMGQKCCSKKWRSHIVKSLKAAPLVQIDSNMAEINPKEVQPLLFQSFCTRLPKVSLLAEKTALKWHADRLKSLTSKLMVLIEWRKGSNYPRKYFWWCHFSSKILIRGCPSYTNCRCARVNWVTAYCIQPRD